MPPRKRSRSAAASTNSSTTAIVLGGGHAHPPRTVAKFRSGALCDVELQAADGTAFRAHAVCLTAGSEYMEALYSAKTEWKDADGPVKLEQVPAAALSVCLDFVYCGEATVARILDLGEPVLLATRALRELIRIVVGLGSGAALVRCYTYE